MSDTIVVYVDNPPAVLEVAGPQGPQGAPGTGLPDGFDLEAVSNTRIKINYTGTDDVTRSVLLTIA